MPIVESLNFRCVFNFGGLLARSKGSDQRQVKQAADKTLMFLLFLTPLKEEQKVRSYKIFTSHETLLYTYEQCLFYFNKRRLVTYVGGNWDMFDGSPINYYNFLFRGKFFQTYLNSRTYYGHPNMKNQTTFRDISLFAFQNDQYSPQGPSGAYWYKRETISHPL